MVTSPTPPSKRNVASPLHEEATSGLSSPEKKVVSQQRLEEASAICAAGRTDWTEGRQQEAQQKFEQALKLLETLLGTYHALTAKTYYWLGFIAKHDASTHSLALRHFCQTARIRLVLLGPSQEATQEALAAISWVLHAQGRSSASIKEYLKQLHESIRLETLGDARLRHRDYTQALQYYQQAMSTFEDPKHATIMGKRAFCAFKGGSGGGKSSNTTSSDHLDEAMWWYRQALMIFCMESVHGKDHPDLPTTLERVGQVLTAYRKYDKAAIQTYHTQTLLESIQLEFQGRQALEQGLPGDAVDNYLSKAHRMEQDLLGKNHPIVKHLKDLIDANSGSSVQSQTKTLAQSNLVQSLQAKINDLELEKKAWTVEKANLESLLHSLRSDSKELQNKSEHARLDVLEYQQKYNDLQVDQNAIKEDLTQSKAAVKGQQDKIVDLESELQRALLEGQEFKDQLKATQETSRALHASLMAQEQMTSTSHQSFPADVNIEKLKAKVKSLQETVSKSDAACKLAERNAKTLQDQQQILQTQLDQRDRAIVSLQGMCQELETALASQTSSATLQTDDSKETQQKLATLQTQLKDLHASKEKDVLTMSRLQSQNERAVHSIKAMSKELLTMEEKNRKLANKYRKLRALVKKADSSKSSNKYPDAIQEGDGTSRSRSGGETDDETGSIGGSSIDTAQSHITPQAVDVRLRGRVQRSQWKFETGHAKYFVRRPFLEDSPASCFAIGNPCLSQREYLSTSHVKEPNSMEVVAQIKADGSSLFLLTNGMVGHRLADGNWNVHSSVVYDECEDPLGWVEYYDSSKNGGGSQYYSLDAVLEEAMLFRQNYCETVLYKMNDRLGTYVTILEKPLTGREIMVDLPTLLLLLAVFVAGIAIYFAQ